LIDRVHFYPFFNAFTRNTATVFMLHRISGNDDNTDTFTTPKLLAYYFDYLKTHNYNVISLTDYIYALSTNKSTYKSVVFTVDDGYRDFYQNAYRVFRDYGYAAAVFLTSDFIEGKLFFWWDTIEYVINNTQMHVIALPLTCLDPLSIADRTHKTLAITQIVDYCKTLPNADKLELIKALAATLEVDISLQPSPQYEPLRWDEILEMSDHGIEFHPHSKTHPIMSHIPVEEIRSEVEIPKQYIEAKLHTKANIFCYPNGGYEDFNEETIAALKSAGYIAAVTGVSGFNDTKGKSDMYRIQRIALPNDPVYFKQYVSGLERFKRRIWASL